MNEGRYEDPKHNIPHKPRIVCVIPLYIPEGRKKDYGHMVEDKFESLKKTLAAHKHFKAGVAYDIVLVNNGSPQDVEYFEAEGYTILHRENEGFGFGAWKHAWEQLGTEYDYYLFTEDDNAPAKDDWLAEILVKFHSEKDVGAVGNIVEAHGHNPISDQVLALQKSHRDHLYCFDGAFTFTSSQVLSIIDVYEDGLPVYPCQPKTPRPATVNELAFQQSILECGYKIVSFAGQGRMIIHGSELWTGDLLNRGPIGPIINHNAGRVVPEVAEAFSWYNQ